ncbi:MAG: MAE_28990/MAE_18760 family HEPN-like nuclease [Methylococcaceae bacterium]
MLAQKINADIDERRELLLQIKTLYLRYHFNKRDEDLFLVYSIASVYAIWEGFVQTTFQFYIDELNTLNLTINTIHEQLLVYHLENRFKQFNEYPKKFDKKVAFLKNLHHFYESKVIIINRVVDTKSNVGFKVMNTILETFNLKPIREREYEPLYSFVDELDKFLLKARNAVAHGNEASITREDLDRAIKLVNILMDLIFDRVMDGFNNRTYLK